MRNTAAHFLTTKLALFVAMRSINAFLFINAFAFCIDASPLANGDEHTALIPRKANAYPSCTSPVLRILDVALTIVGPKATSFCSSYIKASSVTASSTATETLKTTTTTTLGETTSTVTSGVSIVNELTIATTTTIATPAIQTITEQTPVLLNRRTPATPYTPPALKTVAASIASKACSCFLGPSKTTTVSTVITVESISTTTVQSTAQITVPSSTTTITETSISTTTSTAPAVTETVLTAGKSYMRVYGPANGCVYNRYTDYIDLHGDIGTSADGYLEGRSACATRCSNNANCAWWFFYADLEGTSMGYPAWCLLDSLPFSPGYVQCNIPWSGYNVGYNLVV
ncbi:hypothetical protein CC78DRAFT_303165 [Lojkania enalia]|uniref:Uncharacterized protein n=1 Tax=Lojkania enalia TaxID=147567 RepID=A0A9P4N9J2_9PLEO|nr:hypothetical protein CC78DRAFT_303165 [Didymosphaeria enalia]